MWATDIVIISGGYRSLENYFTDQLHNFVGLKIFYIMGHKNGEKRTFSPIPCKGKNLFCLVLSF